MARILVIDDDRLVRATVQTMLAAGGYEAVLAVDGEDGIDQFRNQQVDLVLCDAAMPKKDGLETIRDIRRLSAGIPIISMTGSYPRPSGGAHLDPGFVQMSKQAGATRVIAKPLRLEELLALIRQCLEPGQAQTPRARA
jgi:CheY-like chemotaxis protein